MATDAEVPYMHDAFAGKRTLRPIRTRRCARFKPYGCCRLTSRFAILVCFLPCDLPLTVAGRRAGHLFERHARIGLALDATTG